MEVIILNWEVIEAQDNFRNIIKATAQEPQLIYEQGELVVALVSGAYFQEFLSWQKQQKSTNLAEAFAELREICQSENYSLEIPARVDRVNAFLEVLEDVPS